MKSKMDVVMCFCRTSVISH